jgi:RimJ/RimL family protein N-acetyltransferase
MRWRSITPLRRRFAERHGELSPSDRTVTDVGARRATAQMTRQFIETPRLVLRGLEQADLNEAYLHWLNDPEVLRYRAPKAFPSVRDSLAEYVADARERGDLLLAICLREGGRHIGNIALGNIDWIHRSAELGVLIGATDLWGQGYAREAIAAVSGHAFSSMGLHRLSAGSPNPAFNAAVSSLGWKHEGTWREAFLLDASFVDIEFYGLLAGEFASQASA